MGGDKMSKFKTGDCVTIKNNFQIGYGRKYWIKEYDAITRTYKLTTADRVIDYEDDTRVERCDWRENELDFYGPTPEISSITLTSDEPVKIEPVNTNLFDGAILDTNRLTFSSTNGQTVQIRLNEDGSPYKLYTNNGDKSILSTTTNINKEEIKMKNILDIYKERKLNLIVKAIDEEIIELEKNDEIQQIVEEMNKQINTVLENEGRNKTIKCDINLSYYTVETDNKRNEILNKKQTLIKELNDLVEEVEGLFAMTSDYNERIKILKDYEILNKKGKLVI
jgi:hypothetical protein